MQHYQLKSNYTKTYMTLVSEIMYLLKIDCHETELARYYSETEIFPIKEVIRGSENVHPSFL